MSDPRHDIVEPILKEAGATLRTYFGNVEELHKKSESATDVVTELDHRTEVFIRDRLAQQYPSIGFVGEETGGNRDAERFWLLDPIDGTAHFIRGTPFCTTMLALVQEGQVAMSAIYDFNADEMFFAEKGKGSTRNGEPISVSKRRLGDSYLGYETRIEKPENIALRQRVNEMSIIIQTICAGYEFCLVAAGKIEGRLQVEPYGKDYDYAPGALLVAEAGGVAANIGKSTYDYRNIDSLTTNKVIYEQLTQGEDAIFPMT